MEFITVLSFLAWCFCTLMFFLGMINPKIALFKYAKKGRKQVFLVWFLSGLTFFVIFIIGIESIRDTKSKALISDASASVSSINTSDSEDDAENIATKAPTSTENIQYEEISYYELERNSGKYEGMYFQFSGTVIQISKGILANKIRIAIDDDDDKMIYCTYDCDDIYDEILEKDRIILYGQSTGLETYTSILGQSITIPSIDINLIENITNADKIYTIGDTIIFDGLLISFVGVAVEENENSYSDIKQAVLIEIKITNLKDESYSLYPFYCKCFDPSGLEAEDASYYFEESISQKGDMRSETYMTGYLAYEYTDNGKYILELSKYTGSTIEVMFDVIFEP